jgi:hypothetical protein
MIRGTTPTHTFRLPFDGALIEKAMVIYAQNDVEVLRKELSDCQLEGEFLRCTLTQEDTFKFSCDANVEIQLRLLTTDGNALATFPRVLGVDKCLNDEVL